MSTKAKRCIFQKDIIWFLFKSLFGKHFTYIDNSKNAKTENDIIKGCLRLAWNDAFRHIDCNIKEFNSLSNSDKEEKITNAIEQLVNPFKKFLKDSSLKSAKDSLTNATNGIKKKTAINIGITQKLFNMAVKYYLCIYMFRNELGVEEIVKEYDFKNADCPIDSVILDSLKEKGLKYNGNWSDIKCIETYKEMQEIISENTNGCNLLYDFENWK